MTVAIILPVREPSVAVPVTPYHRGSAATVELLISLAVEPYEAAELTGVRREDVAGTRAVVIISKLADAVRQDKGIARALDCLLERRLGHLRERFEQRPLYELAVLASHANRRTCREVAAVFWTVLRREKEPLIQRFEERLVSELRYEALRAFAERPVATGAWTARTLSSS